MSIETITADIGKASTLLTTVSSDVALALSAYSMLKSIWTRMNPGQTEAQFIAYLQTASQANIDDTAALLIADGYTVSADGKTWTKS